ncbi:hypothetical protein ACFW9L_16455 [Streptomyces sp. NPDC059517]|uniref:hypothetical protein n=1 Tax=Streptomyces sp. NPDC059517 TaxID=3346855 RepID=UPI0036C84E44
MRALLSGEPHAVQLPCEAYTVQVAGRRLELGAVVAFHPEAAVEPDSARAARTALDAGRGDGAEVAVRPADGGRFRLMLQRSLTGSEPVPAPLELPNFPEPR